MGYNLVFTQRDATAKSFISISCAFRTCSMALSSSLTTMTKMIRMTWVVAALDRTR